MYNKPGHPRLRLTEKQVDEQIITIFNKVRQPQTVCDWYARRLRDLTRHAQVESRERTDELQNQLAQLRKQQDQLLNLRLLEEIENKTFRAKSTELRDRISNLTLQLEAADRSRDERADVALKVFELSQHLAEKWLTADYPEKHALLEFVFLNLKLEGATLVPQMRKPFDMLFEGLKVSSSRGDRIRTCGPFS